MDALVTKLKDAKMDPLVSDEDAKKAAAVVTGVEAALQHSFWDTGFGIQINGTYAHSDKQLNTADLTNKFALTGLSDSANGVLFYDKGQFEARAAVNWRDHFLQYLLSAEDTFNSKVTSLLERTCLEGQSGSVIDPQSLPHLVHSGEEGRQPGDTAFKQNHLQTRKP